MVEAAAPAERTPSIREPGRVRVPPLLLGTFVFLASELVFFIALFGAYFTLRAQTTPWPPADADVEPLVSAVATILLVVSSGTYVLAARAARRHDPRGFRRWVVATFALGAVFLGLQLVDYAQLGFSVSAHAYGTLFYAMTGFHGAHVVAGLILMLVVWGRSIQGAYAAGEPLGVEAVGYYWHFVDVVWIALFATLYLLR
jgi:cytochrome c oxidase subunit III